MKQTLLEKRTSHAFGKDVYLLGEDEDGIWYWLEEPSWDCGWYWGFGYIETYTNNKHPDKSMDILSHEHAEDFYREWLNRRLKTTTFTENEKWKLVELFENFYTLRKLACAQAHEGKEGNYTSQRNGFDYRKLFKDEVNINRDCIPEVMAKIVSILSGQETKTLTAYYKNKIN